MNEGNIAVDCVLPKEFRANKTIEFKLVASNSKPRIVLPVKFVKSYFLLSGFRLISQIDLMAVNKEFIAFEDNITIPEDLSPIEKAYKVQPKDQEELEFRVSLYYNSRLSGFFQYQFRRTEKGIFVPK